MQTFMPYENYAQCAHVLDSQRLGKQRVEVLQILHALREPNYGWQNHPAVAMWRGHAYFLALYGKIMCKEWVRRGYKDTCWGKIDKIQQDIMHAYHRENIQEGMRKPWWDEDPRVHISHQSNLIRKNPGHYKAAFPGVPDDLPYFWPSTEQPPNRFGLRSAA